MPLRPDKLIRKSVISQNNDLAVLSDRAVGPVVVLRCPDPTNPDHRPRRDCMVDVQQVALVPRTLRWATDNGKTQRWFSWLPEDAQQWLLDQEWSCYGPPRHPLELLAIEGVLSA